MATVVSLLKYLSVYNPETRNLKLERNTVQKTEKPERIVKRKKKPLKSSDNKIWLYGIHAVRDALKNDKRIKHSLMITPNAYKKIEPEILKSSVTIEIIDPRKFFLPVKQDAVHQGVALQVNKLEWGSLSEICTVHNKNKLVLFLDRVSDPQNVGAILRSAEVFGATAVASPTRYSAPETGALAKAASGALERQPYLRLTNLARAMSNLKKMGYCCIGLDGAAGTDIVSGIKKVHRTSIALIVGAEGTGIRELTLKNCDYVFRIPSNGEFGSLNVSNAAALSLFITRNQLTAWNDP